MQRDPIERRLVHQLLDRDPPLPPYPLEDPAVHAVSFPPGSDKEWNSNRDATLASLFRSGLPLRKSSSPGRVRVFPVGAVSALSCVHSARKIR